MVECLFGGLGYLEKCFSGLYVVFVDDDFFCILKDFVIVICECCV